MPKLEAGSEPTSGTFQVFGFTVDPEGAVGQRIAFYALVLGAIIAMAVTGISLRSEPTLVGPASAMALGLGVLSLIRWVNRRDTKWLYIGAISVAVAVPGLLLQAGIDIGGMGIPIGLAFVGVAMVHLTVDRRDLWRTDLAIGIVLIVATIIERSGILGPAEWIRYATIAIVLIGGAVIFARKPT